MRNSAFFYTYRFIMLHRDYCMRQVCISKVEKQVFNIFMDKMSTLSHTYHARIKDGYSLSVY